jgi:hypothetical protein
LSTARGRHAVLQVQEGHSIGCLGVWEAQPQFSGEIELPRRFAIGRRAARGVSEAHDFCEVIRQERCAGGFPNVLTAKRRRR